MFFDFDVDNRNDLSHILLDEQSVHDYIFKMVGEINNILDRVVQVPSAVEVHVWLTKSNNIKRDDWDMYWNVLILGDKTDATGFTTHRLTLGQVHTELIQTFNRHKSVYTFKQLFDAMLTDLTYKM